MDLYAYSQIENYIEELSDILEKIPRLRGIRNMAEMTPEEANNRQMEVYNGHCGETGVYMIHARVGGNNWKYYDMDEIKSEPWFIEAVDDDFDSTYCDIYVRHE